MGTKAIPQPSSPSTTLLARLYFADLTSTRLYAALSSMVWAVAVLSSSEEVYKMNWEHLHTYVSKQEFAFVAVLVSGAQLFLLNCEPSKWANRLDFIVYGSYFGFWCHAAFSSVFLVNTVSQEMLANHILLASLGFWIFSRGFSNLKTR